MFAVLKRIADRAPSYIAYVIERPGWAPLLLLGRLLWARRLERKLRAKGIFGPLLPDSEDVVTPPGDFVQDMLREDGVCRGFALHAETVQQIMDFAVTNKCFPRGKDRQGFFVKDYLDSGVNNETSLLAAYYFESVNRSSTITRLRSDPRLVALARRFLGQEARNIRVRLWWSFPSDCFDDLDLRRAAQDSFHFDLNDWRTVKFFFYITEVTPGSGPHIYVRGSHRVRRLRHQYTVLNGKNRSDLERFYGLDSFLTITGPPGSGFAEDPFIFHTGLRAISNPRLILELEFGPYEPSQSYKYGTLG